MSLSEAALNRGVRPMAEAAGGRSDAVTPRSRASWAAEIAQALDAERGRWFLWLPVFFGGGVALYLSSPTEPPLTLAIAAVMLGGVLRVFLHSTAPRLIMSSVLLAMALGLLTAKLHALAVDAPVLDRTLRYMTVEGWVEQLERRDSRVRLTLRLIHLNRLPREHWPRRVRVSVRGDPPAVLPGDAIRLRATLMSPPEPALPGGFDFARFYWFKGIGASGYAMGKIEALDAPPPEPWDLAVRAWFANLRHAIAARIGAVLDGDSGAIAKALVVGQRGELSEEARQSLRDAGLAHVIAISGFHMALTAGAMFWLIRAVLALFPGIALRFPIKVWAAIGALAIASLYLAVSGAAVTAVRAYIMVAIIFIAVILNRPALSLRNLAIAALLILAAMPQSLIDAGFQMSFAATAALIAFYEVRFGYRFLEGWPALVALPLLFLAEVLTTTVLASLAVDPFAAYHFNRIALYSVLGNLLAMPIVAFAIMPMVLLSLLAMPVGLEAGPLWLMRQGIDAMLVIANFTSTLPGASLMVPYFADGALSLLIAGGLWLMIWRGGWRWFGLIGIAAGLALAPLGERPDIWIDREGKLVAIRDKDGAIATPDNRKASFSLERWMEADGDDRPVKEARGSKAFRCDRASCIALVKGKLVSHLYHPSGLAEDCRRAAILIATFPMPERCRQPELVIDSLDLKEGGAHTLRIEGNRIIVRTANGRRGNRPWVMSYRRRQRIPAIASEGDSGANVGGKEGGPSQ